MNKTSRNRNAARVVVAGILTAVLFYGCGSSNDSASTTTTTTTKAQQPKTADDIRGMRYCEVLLITPVDQGVVANVYVSFPMNDCPQAEWSALVASEIAAANNAPIAVLNGPRYWLMDSIEKVDSDVEPLAQDFGGIEMIRRATVAISNILEAAKPYNPNHVKRATVFTFDAGQTVFELTDAEGSKYVMQSWSQQVDPTLKESSLAGLSSRLKLPEGWSYSSRKLAKKMRVVTTTTDAVVVQDELKNSYSLETLGA